MTGRKPTFCILQRDDEHGTVETYYTDGRFRTFGNPIEIKAWKRDAWALKIIHQRPAEQWRRYVIRYIYDGESIDACGRILRPDGTPRT